MAGTSAPTSSAATASVAAATDRDRVIATAVTAFSNDPWVRWIYPEPGQYLASFPGMVHGYVGEAFAHGSAYHTDGFAGAAFWIPPGIHPDEDAVIEHLQRTVAADHQEHVFAFLEELNAHFPNEPTWYLPCLAVDPRHQGRGLGSRLMAHALATCDAQHMPAYLESTNERNLPLYERHGFEVIAQVEAAGSPPVWPMYRKAR